jgi:hypothetical protein
VLLSEWPTSREQKWLVSGERLSYYDLYVQTKIDVPLHRGAARSSTGAG